jgi:hypothetical protein
VELNNYASKEGFFALNVSQDFKTDESPQYYLSKSSFRYLPLTKFNVHELMSPFFTTASQRSI